MIPHSIYYKENFEVMIKSIAYLLIIFFIFEQLELQISQNEGKKYILLVFAN